MSFFSRLWNKIKELKTYSLYLVIGGIVFIIGLVFHFPLEHFSSMITSTIQKETGYVVQMNRVSIVLPIGISAQDIKISPPPSAGQPFTLVVDELTLRPSVFSLLTYPFRKSIGFSYKAIRGKEKWSGSAGLGKEMTSIDIEVKNFEWNGSFSLDQNPMFAGRSIKLSTIVDLDLSLQGKTLAIQQGNFSQANGSLDIHSKKTDIDAPIVNTLNLSDFTLKSNLKNGMLNLSDLNFKAPNLSGKSKGSIKVEPFFPNSQINLEAELTPDPSDKNISSLIQLLGTMYNIAPSAEGALSLKVNGALNSPESLAITGH